MSCEAGNDLDCSTQSGSLSTDQLKDRQPGSSFPAAHPRSPGHPRSHIKRERGAALVSAPKHISIGPEGVYTSKCNAVSGAPVSSLPRSVLLLSGDNSKLIPFRVLWDSGSSHCVLSPRAARRLGFVFPDNPEGHGTMTVADGSTTLIYGWTSAIRVAPPHHLRSSSGSLPLVTHLASMQCLVADISEDVIIGFDYILPSHGQFFEDIKGQRFFQLCPGREPASPTVKIPLTARAPGSGNHARWPPWWTRSGGPAPCRWPNMSIPLSRAPITPPCAELRAGWPAPPRFLFYLMV